jgi:hypothetical protein
MVISRMNAMRERDRDWRSRRVERYLESTAGEDPSIEQREQRKCEVE